MKLVVLEGPAARPSFEVNGQRTLVGRAPDCDVLVYDAQVSRHHAQILKHGDTYIIESLQPTNPFIVNDRVISTRRQLADGDLIVLGSVVMEVDLPPVQAAPAADNGLKIPASPPPTAVLQAPTVSVPAEAAPRTPTPAPERLPATPAPSSGVMRLTPVRTRASEPPVTRVVERARPPRSRALPTLPPHERIKEMATRLGEAGQRLRTRADAAPGGLTVSAGDISAVRQIVMEHERLGGDQELARLATLLSDRLSNQTDIRALYRLGAEAAVLIAWSRIAQRSMEEATHLAQALGVH